MGFEWKLGKKSSRHRYGSALLILYGDAMSREHLHRIPSQSCFLGEKLGIFLLFFFLSTESRIESSNVDSWNPFSKNAIRISNFCISELLLVLLKSFSHSFSLVRMFRVKRKMFYEIGIFFRQDIIGTLRVSSNLQFLSYFSFLHW